MSNTLPISSILNILSDIIKMTAALAGVERAGSVLNALVSRDLTGKTTVYRINSCVELFIEMFGDT